MANKTLTREQLARQLGIDPERLKRRGKKWRPSQTPKPQNRAQRRRR